MVALLLEVRAGCAPWMQLDNSRILEQILLLKTVCLTLGQLDRHEGVAQAGLQEDAGEAALEVRVAELNS